MYQVDLQEFPWSKGKYSVHVKNDKKDIIIWSQGDDLFVILEDL